MKKGIVIVSGEEGNRVEHTDYVVYSYDKDSFKFVFYFPELERLANQQALLVIVGETLPRQRYDLTINDGKAEWMVPESLLGYEGHVKGYLHTSVNGQPLSDEDFMFTFSMKRSEMDKDVYQLQNTYYDLFDDAVEQIQLKAENTQLRIQTVFADALETISATQDKIRSTDGTIDQELQEIYDDLRRYYSKSKSTMDKEVVKVVDSKVTAKSEIEQIVEELRDLADVGVYSKVYVDDLETSLKNADTLLTRAVEFLNTDVTTLESNLTETNIEVTATKDEVILARGESQTLGERLDSDKVEVTAQLAQKATKEELKTEKGRIDNIVAHSGNTDGNTELLDIRVGLDGNIYSSAGDNVRANTLRIQELKQETVANPKYDFVIKNMIDKGNFPDDIEINEGLDDEKWGVRSYVDYEVSNNTWSATASGDWPCIIYKDNFIAGHKLLVRFDYWTDVPSSFMARFESPGGADKQWLLSYVKGDKEWRTYKQIITKNKTNDRILFRTERSPGSTLSLRNVSIVDLTETFGVGKEPTIEEFEELIRGDYWFQHQSITPFLYDMILENKKNISNISGELVPNINNVMQGEGYLKRLPFYHEDMCFVGNELWGFSASDTGSVGNINIYDDQTFDLKKQLIHDFGHCNSVDYNEETDSLIFGNGSRYYNTDGVFYIIEGVKEWSDLPDGTTLNLDNILIGELVKYEVGTTWGSKINACWGESNLNENNIAYIMSNDNQNIRKVLLGKGTNELERGLYKTGKSNKQFNGTYKVLKEHVFELLDNNQGSVFYNGSLYSNLGHDNKWSVKYALNYNEDMIQRREDIYTELGTPKVMAGAGIAIRGVYIYHGLRSGGLQLFKYPVF